MMHDLTLLTGASVTTHNAIAQTGGLQNGQAELWREELDVLCHALSHDLRAPLRSIGGFSKVVLDSLCEKLDEQAAANFQRVIKATQDMGRLLDGLLQLTRVTRHPMRKTVVDLSDIAQGIVARFRGLHPEKEIKVTITPQLTASGDPLLLELALEQLFENAWKFSRSQSPARICFGGNCDQTESVFYLYDNGIGFDMASYHELFGVFQRLHHAPDLPGCGIGLAIVKRILQRHNGNIWAKGIPDLGACFWFNIPNDATHETTLHSHDRRQRKRRNARADRVGTAVTKV